MLGPFFFAHSSTTEAVFVHGPIIIGHLCTRRAFFVHGGITNEDFIIFVLVDNTNAL